jgi:excisionase family DNA binding protein
MIPTAIPVEASAQESREKITVRQAAALLGSSTPFVYDLLRRNAVDHYRFGSMIRIDRSSLEEYIARSRQAASE